MTRLTDEQRGFRSGVAVTLAILARHYDKPSVAADILGEIGLTVSQLKSAGVEEYDLAPLRKATRQSA